MASSAEIETPTNGNEPRCTKCGAGPHPKLPGRCAGSPSHFIRGNRAAAITGQHGANFWREHSAEINAMADQFSREAGYSSLSAAPLGFQIAAVALSRTAKIGDLAYKHMLEAGGPLSESGKPRRAYSIWADNNRDLARDLKGAMSEVLAARPPGNGVGNEHYDFYNAMSSAEIAAVCEQFAAELRALGPAVPDHGALRALPILDTRVDQQPAFSRNEPPASPPEPPASAVPTVAGASRPEPLRVSPAPFPGSSPSPSLASDGSRRTRTATWGGPPSAPTDSAPTIYVYNRLVREADVRQCMEDSGDLANYESGRISKRRAFEITAAWIKGRMEFPR